MGFIFEGIGASGSQGKEKTDTTTSRTGRSSSTGKDTGSTRRSGSTISEEFEEPELSPFRKALLDLFGEEFQAARQPKFGEAEQSKFISNLNDLTGKASSSIAQRLAKTGAGRSGRAASAIGALETSRAGDITEFFRDLPFQEREARSSATTPLLDIGLGFAGRGPRQSRVTSSEKGEADSFFSREKTSQEDSEVNQILELLGKPLGRSLATAIGGRI